MQTGSLYHITYPQTWKLPQHCSSTYFAYMAYQKICTKCTKYPNTHFHRAHPIPMCPWVSTPTVPLVRSTGHLVGKPDTSKFRKCNMSMKIWVLNWLKATARVTMDKQLSFSSHVTNVTWSCCFLPYNFFFIFLLHCLQCPHVARYF